MLNFQRNRRIIYLNTLQNKGCLFVEMQISEPHSLRQWKNTVSRPKLVDQWLAKGIMRLESQLLAAQSCIRLNGQISITRNLNELIPIDDRERDQHNETVLLPTPQTARACINRLDTAASDGNWHI